MKALQRRNAAARRAPFRARPRADFSNEYRQRLRDGIALAWPLFAPGLRRTLNTVCLLTLLTALSVRHAGQAATDHLAR